MTILLVSAYFILFLSISYWIGKRFIKDVANWFLPFLFSIKFLVALFFLYVYTYHYGGGELTADAGRFFKESYYLYTYFYTDPSAFFTLMTNLGEAPELSQEFLNQIQHWKNDDSLLPNDSRNVVRFNALIHFLSHGNIIIHFLIFSFFSFLGGIDLYHFIKKYTSLSASIVLIATTLTPSVAFWGASIIKEPFLILGLCLMIRAIYDTIHWKKRLWRFIIGGALMLMFKPYVLLCLITAGIFFWIISTLFKKYTLQGTILLFSLGVATLFFTGIGSKMVNGISHQQEKFLNISKGGLYLRNDTNSIYYIYFGNRSKFDIKNNSARLKSPIGATEIIHGDSTIRKKIFLDAIGQRWEIIYNLEKAGSGVNLTPIDNSGLTMFKMIPEVLFNSLLRPLPKDNGSWLKYLALLENLGFIVIAIIAFFICPKKLSLREKHILLSFFVFSFSLILIIGWTTPVIGAIVRYKVPATLVLTLILMIKLNPHKKLRSEK